MAAMPLVIEGCRNIRVFEKTSALKSAAGGRVCAGAVADSANSMGKSQKTFLEFVIREAWRVCAAAQGFFSANNLTGAELAGGGDTEEPPNTPRE